MIKERSGRTWTVRTPARSAAVLQHFTRSPQNSVNQCACNCGENYLQQDGAPPHYHQNVRAYLDDIVPGQWIGRRGAIEYPPQSSDLTPLDVYLWGTLKKVYQQMPATWDAL